MEETKICPYCGSNIPANAKKCMNCGEWLTSHIQEKDKPKSELHIGGFIEGIICIILVIYMFNNNFDFSDGLMFLILILYIALHIYFLPSLIADERRTQYTCAIFALNLLLGLTVVGWIGSLIWALSLPDLSKNIATEKNDTDTDTDTETDTEKTKPFNEAKTENRIIQEIHVQNINTSSIKDIDVDMSKIKKWNWGAFWLPWIWGIDNKSWIALLAFIPYFNIIWQFVCGYKGNEWAWKNKNWKSLESFHHSQKMWAIIGNSLVILSMILALILYIVVQNMPNKSTIDQKQNTLQEKTTPNIEKHEEIIDISEEEYNQLAKENKQKQHSEARKQSPHLKRQEQHVTQSKQQLKTQTNVTTQQAKSLSVEQHNQDIEDFMN